MRKIAALDCNRENDAWVPRRGHVAVRSASARVWCIRRREWLAFAPSLVRRDPSRLLASRRACMGINRENDKARTSPSPHPTGVSLIHLVHFVQRMSLRRSLPASLPRLLAASSASSFAGRGRDRGRGRGGEKEWGRRKAGRRGRAGASEASKEERASEETRTSIGGGKEDYYYSWGPPHHTACRRDASL